MAKPVEVLKVSVDYTLRVLSVIAIANVLLISVLVVYIDKESKAPIFIDTLGVPVSITLGILLMLVCSFPGVIAKKLNLTSAVYWYVFRLPALCVVGVAINLFLLA